MEKLSTTSGFPPSIFLTMIVKHAKKIIIGTLILAILATSGVFGAKFARQAYFKWQIQSFISENPDMNRFYVSSGHTSPDAYIAHGGGIKEYVWTNSVEAVEDSLKRGFKFIELDLLVTTDGHLVGGHDWRELRQSAGMGGTDNTPLPYAQAKNIRVNGKYTPIGGEEITKFMQDNPDVILVTDKIRDFELLVREVPFPDRIIAEVERPKHYVQAIKAGIKYPAIFMRRPSDLKTAKEYGFPIITMDAGAFFENEASARQVQELHNAGVTVFICNKLYDTPDFLKKHLGRSVSKIYTDNWAPTALP